MYIFLVFLFIFPTINVKLIYIKGINTRNEYYSYLPSGKVLHIINCLPVLTPAAKPARLGLCKS